MRHFDDGTEEEMSLRGYWNVSDGRTRRAGGRRRAQITPWPGALLICQEARGWRIEAKHIGAGFFFVSLLITANIGAGYYRLDQSTCTESRCCEPIIAAVLEPTGLYRS